jgi:hypothetical protein
MLDRLVYRPSVPKVVVVQPAIVKQGCEAKMALDTEREMIDSTTKVV